MHLITWLGIVWEGIRGKISITTPRIDKALHHIDNALQDPRLSARSLASIVGKIISMSPVLGNLGRIMTRHCQMSVAAAQDWDSNFQNMYIKDSLDSRLQLTKLFPTFI